MGTYVQTQHDDHDDVVGQGEIDIVHDQQLLVSEARLSLDAGITRRFAASLVLPVRVVGTSIRYLDTRGSEVRLVHENIHHRNETVAGIGDLMLLGSTSLSVGRWRLTARAGLTLPTGRTEENPFALGDQGLRHQHIQLGTGTLNPVVGAEVARSWGRWRFGVFALSQQVVYENAKGYQAGDRYATGAVLRRQLGPRWTVRGSMDVLAETAERWEGMTPTDDGNRGRFDLIFGAGASWAATKQLGLDVALKVPVITRAVGGQLDMPGILELGASWSFGGPARPADAQGGDDHGHGHDGHGHDHDHGHDGHGHDDHGHDDHGHDGHGGHGHDHDGHDEHAHAGARPVDTRGLDVADLGQPGEAVDLVPVTGKVTIFDFWATWCEPCKVLEPALLEIARAHPEIVAIRRIDTVDWDSAAVARHLTPKGFNLPHLKVFDAAGRMVIERSSERGKLDALVADVRALVEAEAARRASATPAAPVYSIAVTSRGFEPGEIEVPAGKPVTLRFVRRTEHTCATEVVMSIDGQRIAKDLPLNQAVDLTVTFPRPGKVTYACAMDMIRGSIHVATGGGR